jgi:hypothetical protein
VEELIEVLEEVNPGILQNCIGQIIGIFSFIV